MAQYGFAANLWFTEAKGNTDVVSVPVINTTFADGGYFSVEVGGMTFICLNSLHFSSKNTEDTSFGVDQMLWLNTTLSELDENAQVIIYMHINPGVYVN